jgi:tetratricopeptide (TPR) repeat protein
MDITSSADEADGTSTTVRIEMQQQQQQTAGTVVVSTAVDGGEEVSSPNQGEKRGMLREGDAGTASTLTLHGRKLCEFGLAICYILEDRRIQAAQLLQQLIASDPTFEPAYRALGECYEDAGDGKAMVALGKRLQSVDASNPVAWYLLGAGSLKESAQDQALLASAIAYLQHAVNLDPASARYHFMLGKAFEEEHSDSKEIEELREAVRLDPDHPRAHYVLAQLYQRLGERQLAQAQFAAHDRIKGKERGSQYRLLLTRAALQ